MASLLLRWLYFNCLSTKKPAWLLSLEIHLSLCLLCVTRSFLLAHVHIDNVWAAEAWTSGLAHVLLRGVFGCLKAASLLLPRKHQVLHCGASERFAFLISLTLVGVVTKQEAWSASDGCSFTSLLGAEKELKKDLLTAVLSTALNVYQCGSLHWLDPLHSLLCCLIVEACLEGWFSCLTAKEKLFWSARSR